jgi:2-iminobutanoate/2-iminopropanoate deaminase
MESCCHTYSLVFNQRHYSIRGGPITMARRPAKKAAKKSAKKAPKKAAKKSAKKAAKRAVAPAARKATRTEIAAPDIPLHPQPFPTACKVGNVIFSSAISGEDPVTHEFSSDPRSQVENAFRTVRRVMEVAGGSLDNIGKVVVYVKDREIRPIVNEVWQKVFANEKSRPVRHMVPFDLPPGRHLQVEFIAVL